MVMLMPLKLSPRDVPARKPPPMASAVLPKPGSPPWKGESAPSGAGADESRWECETWESEGGLVGQLSTPVASRW